LGIYGFIDRLQRWAGRSRGIARGAALLSNQCARIIGYHFSPSPDADVNGEALLVKRLGPRISTFVDVGANVGNWTERVLAVAPQLQLGALIEPSDSAFSKLSERFSSHPNLRLFHCALGDSVQEVAFYEELGAGETSSIFGAFSRSDAVQRTVETQTLDDIAEQVGLKRIDLVKIDCEGYDFHAIRGARRLIEAQAIGVVQFEYNRPWALSGSTLGGAIQWLSKFGYAVFVLTPRGLLNFDYRRFGDFFSYSNFVAVSPQARELLTGLRLTRDW
jgi:FkbM family methyltransferase